MPTQSELEAQQQQIEAERIALEAEQAQIERDYQAAEASRIEAEKAAQAESTYFTPFADRPDAVAEDLSRRKELEYNTRLEDTQKRYEQARAGYEQRVAKFQERASIFESGREGFNKNIDVYNAKQDDFAEYLGKVAEGKESIQKANIRTWFVNRGTTRVGLYTGGENTSDRYSEGEYGGISQEELEQKAIEGTRKYLNLGSEDIITINGRVIQESIFNPEQINIAGDVFSGRQAALAQYERARAEEQDRLKAGWDFAQQDTAKLQGLLNISSAWNMDAVQTNALLAGNLKGSYAKEAREGMQYTVGGVVFSKPDIANQYAKQLSGLDYHPDNIVAPAPGEYGYHATPSNPAGLFQPQPKEMPKDINPVTGRGWAEPESPLQKYEDAEKWYNKLTPSAQLSGGVTGALLSNDMFSTTYQSLLENSPTAKHVSNLLKRGINKTGLGTTSSLLFGGGSVIPFELESAKMGGTTITYEKVKEPTPKQKYALAFKTNIEKNYPDYEKGYTPYQAVKTGLTAAIKSANLFSDDSGVLGVTIGAAGFGGGLGAASRVKVLGRPLIGATGMKTIGYGATAITGISAIGKTAEGQYGSAASDVAMFAIGVPAAVAGYQAAPGIIAASKSLSPLYVSRQKTLLKTNIPKVTVQSPLKLKYKTVATAEIPSIGTRSPIFVSGSRKVIGVKIPKIKSRSPIYSSSKTLQLNAPIGVGVRAPIYVTKQPFSIKYPVVGVRVPPAIQNTVNRYKYVFYNPPKSTKQNKRRTELIRSLGKMQFEKAGEYAGWQEENPKYIERSETVLVAETRPATQSWYHFRPAKGKVIAKKNIVSNKPAGKTMRFEEALPANWKDAPLGRSTSDIAVGSGKQMVVLKTAQQLKQATKTVLSAKKVITREKVASDYVQEYAQKQKTMPKTVTKGKFKGFVLVNPVEDTTVTEYDYSTTYPQKQSNIIGLRQNTTTGIRSKVSVAIGNLNIVGVRTDTSQLSKQMQKQIQFQRQEPIQKQKQKQVTGLKQISLQRQKQTTKQKLITRQLNEMVTRQKPKGASRIITKGKIKLPSGSGKSLFGTRKAKGKSFSFMEYTPVAMPKNIKQKNKTLFS